MSMPKQKPGKSKQDYGTPPEFLAAVKNRLCIENFGIDLAASNENAVCPRYFNEAFDSLRDNVTWDCKGAIADSHWSWLNPPFANITPWVAKAAKEAQHGAHVAILVPASVGANWWRDWVEPYAYQTFLNGRLQFVGTEGLYPKDCALLLYTPWQFMGHDIWNWRASVPQLQQPELSEDQGVSEMFGLSFQRGL